MKKIYIAKDYENNPMAVLLAESQEQAELVWIGAKLQHHSTEEIDPSDDTTGMFGVVTLLSSIEIQKSDIEHKPYDWKLRVWKRGS